MATLDCTCDLAGRGVLVTRPVHQAGILCRCIEECGGRPITFPALEILPPSDPTSATALLTEEWDLVIYASANAARFALELTPMLPTAQVAAVGRGTARLLEQASILPNLVPEREESEGLLDLEPLQQLSGRRVLIVRGEGGRTLLRDILRERGAEVAFAEVYRRALPQTDPTELVRRWPKDVQAVTTTSIEVLENLWSMLGPDGRALLRTTPLIMVSERMKGPARRMGIHYPILADGAGESALLAALCTLLEPPQHISQTQLYW